MRASFDKLQNRFHIYLLIKTDYEADFLEPKYGTLYKKKNIEVYFFHPETKLQSCLSESF